MRRDTENRCTLVPPYENDYDYVKDFPMKANDLIPKQGLRALVAVIWISACWGALAGTVHYVDVNSTNATPPYTNWSTAAVSIQDAVGVAVSGDQVLVADGVYATGAVTASGAGSTSNRVAIFRPITVQSVNGPGTSIIEGYQVPGITNGPGAIRCVCLGSRAVLSGFTLTKGATQAGIADFDNGGGVCVSGGSGAIVTNCVLKANSARFKGGGFYEPGNGTWLIDCILVGNSGPRSVSAGSQVSMGGGAYGGIFQRSVVYGNSAAMGGGAANSLMLSCSIFGNSAAEGGGACGVINGTCSLNACTVVGNQADHAGGTSGATLYNCIVYFNVTRGSAPNYYGGSLNYCCTTPMPTAGTGNFAANPQLASITHLSAASPCRGAGIASPVAVTDIDGEPWCAPPSIGCDEYWPGAVTGPLQVALSATYSNVTTDFQVDFTAFIGGRTAMSYWDFGDGTTLTNQPCVSHIWSRPGDYPVVLTACNESNPEGVRASFAVRVRTAPLHYVAVGSTNPVPPFLSWETAATNIQSAVDAADTAGASVLVGDGVYATGGRAVAGTMTNRVAIDRPVIVQSLNGPAVTVIQGFQVSGVNGEGAIRCVYLADQAVLAGFTLTNGATRTLGDEEGEQKGGGVWCASLGAVVTNCVLSGNAAKVRGGAAYRGTLNHCTLVGNVSQYGGGCYGSAVNNSTLYANRASTYGGAAYAGWVMNCLVVSNSANTGGGVFEAMLDNCVVVGNLATYGGGATGATLNNCTVVGNSANSGGGARNGTFNNCIVYSNSPANYYSATINYCCTTPMPASGTGNFTNGPHFVDYLGGDFHLAPSSPCINAGRNAFVSTSTDLDGNSRIAGGTVDFGAYEFQAPTSVISYAWLQSYSLPTDGSADFIDSDLDGMNNWQEWRCQTVPTNAVSALRLISAAPVGTNVTVNWQSVPGVNYFLERATNLAMLPPFQLVATNIAGQLGTTTRTDTNAGAFSPLLYRVGVGP